MSAPLTLLALLVVTSTAQGSTVADVFETYLASDGPVADGFSPALRADAPRAVFAIGAGRVVSITGTDVAIAHTYYENHHRRTIRSTYAPLERVDVAVGDLVSRGQTIGRIGARVPPVFAPGAEFVRAHRRLFVPQVEPVLLLVDHATHRVARYERGRPAGTAPIRTDTYEVAFGQAEGQKEVQGDLRTPKGMYFVVHHHRGEFPGRYGDYYGGHWIKLNYPNAYDADRGLERGQISKETAAKITKAWRRRKLTNQKTRLGGGIGFHGWAGPWKLEDGGGLSWGCVVMHTEDITKMYDRVPIGTMVVIF